MPVPVDPNTLANNTLADASAVEAKFDVLFNYLNGNVDQDAIKAAAVGTTELADDAVTPAKILASDVLMAHALGESGGVGANGTLQVATGLAFSMPAAGSARLLLLTHHIEYGASGVTSWGETISTQVDALGYVPDGGIAFTANAVIDPVMHTYSRVVAGLSAGAHTLDIRLIIANNPVTVKVTGGLVLVLAV